MAGYGRTKRVTDPLDDKARDRIVGRETLYVSSGSEHGGEIDDDSPCLFDLVHGFLEEEDAEASLPENELDFECDLTDLIEDLEKTTIRENADAFRNGLANHVSQAIAVFSSGKTDKQMLRRNVMAFLRNYGFNAAICKTKWETCGGLTAGNYELVDVLRADSGGRQQRYFVDIDFAGEFVIARPTSQYERMLKALPNVFVGKTEELKQIVKVMSDAARRSLKSRGLHLPPWRKNRFMQNKWFGPYRRTTNIFPAMFNSKQGKATATVKCRSVGFDVANSCHFVPATTRTR